MPTRSSYFRFWDPPPYLLGAAGWVFLTLLAGCTASAPKSPASVADEATVSRLRKENQDLEARLRELQAERDVGQASLARCRGTTPGGAEGTPSEDEQAHRNLPVVRLVPEASSPTAGAETPGDERLVLRASGDAAGEITPAPPEPEDAELPANSGVSFSEPENSKPTSPPKPETPAEKSSR